MFTKKMSLIAAIAVFFLAVLLYGITRDTKRENANYMIVSSNEKTYYADTFRIIGRGIMFDDVYGKKIILMGNIDIQYIKNEL